MHPNEPEIDTEIVLQERDADDLQQSPHRIGSPNPVARRPCPKPHAHLPMSDCSDGIVSRKANICVIYSDGAWLPLDDWSIDERSFGDGECLAVSIRVA